MSADPQLAAWRLARAGKWDRFERLLRSSPDARRFIRMLPYQMYFEGYERAEHIARELDAALGPAAEQVRHTAGEAHLS